MNIYSNQISYKEDSRGLQILDEGTQLCYALSRISVKHQNVKLGISLQFIYRGRDWAPSINLQTCSIWFFVAQLHIYALTRVTIAATTLKNSAWIVFLLWILKVVAAQCVSAPLPLIYSLQMRIFFYLFLWYHQIEITCSSMLFFLFFGKPVRACLRWTV